METYTTPLVTRTRYSTGPIIISFLVLIVIMSVILFIYTDNSYKPRIRKLQTILVQIENRLPYDVHTSLGSAVIHANGSLNVYLRLLDRINFDGKEIRQTFTLNNDRIRKVFLTEGGINTNLNSNENVEILNNSNIPIVLIQQSLLDRVRRAVVVLQPGMRTMHLIGWPSEWQVAILGRENVPISSLYLSHRVDKLHFDGVQLNVN